MIEVCEPRYYVVYTHFCWLKLTFDQFADCSLSPDELTIMILSGSYELNTLFWAGTIS